MDCLTLATSFLLKHVPRIKMVKTLEELALETDSCSDDSEEGNPTKSRAPVAPTSSTEWQVVLNVPNSNREKCTTATNQDPPLPDEIIFHPVQNTEIYANNC